MKSTLKLVNSVTVLFFMTILLFMFNKADAQKSPKSIKIGTYDSRVITLAYSRSDTFNIRLSDMQKQSQADFQGNDSTKKVQAAYRMITFQFLLHQQVFCTGTTSAIIAIVKDKLPQVAKDAGVSSIVSKWELSYNDPSVEIVDLTMPISRLFNPKGDFENMAKEITVQNPVPIEELTIEEVVQMWKQFESKNYRK
jgi:hypothetical protein